MTPSAFLSPRFENEENKHVLLAFSGGTDSSVLLDLLVKDAEQNHYRITLIHINHGIRKTAKRDEDFCRERAEFYHLPIRIFHGNVPDLAQKRKEGIEEAGRRFRYDCFLQTMQEENIPVLVTAHHQSDQAETLLFRLCRGSGSRGLSGMKAITPFGKGTLQRPLLYTKKEEIEQYAKENNIPYVTDETNADLSYARNALRHRVLPVLAELNEQAISHVAKSATLWAEENEALDFVAQAHANEERPALLRLPIALQKRILMQKYETECGDYLSSEQLDAMLTILQKGYGSYALNDTFRFSVEKEKPVFYSDAEWTEKTVPFSFDKTEIPGTNITVFVQKNQETSRKIPRENTLLLQKNVIINSLYYRPYCEGDKYLFAGHHRPVRKLWNERKIPQRLRKILPILCDEKGILWVPFVGMRDGESGEKYIITPEETKTK